MRDLARSDFKLMASYTPSGDLDVSMVLLSQEAADIFNKAKTNSHPDASLEDFITLIAMGGREEESEIVAKYTPVPTGIPTDVPPELYQLLTGNIIKHINTMLNNESV